MGSDEKTIVVLGGGVGGLTTANDLRKKLGKEHRIIIVDKNREHISASSFLWVMCGCREPEQIKKDISRLIESGIDLINEDILRIDTQNKTVKTEKKEIAYDYLVISLGASLFPEAVPGLEDALKKDACNIYTLDGILKARDRIKNFSGGDIIVLVTSMPYKCPAAPYETAFLLKDIFRKRGLEKNVNVKIFAPETLPMPVAGAAVGNMIKAMLEQMGIAHNFEHKVASIDAEKKEITFDKGRASYDLLLVVPPHKSPEVIRKSGLTEDWIPADKDTLKTQFENVYAIGDVAKVKIPGEWKPGVPLMLPKAGVFAHFEAKVVAENIANEILKTGEKAEYTGEGGCFIEIGDGTAGFGSGNFYATPNPQVIMRKPSPLWHLGKVIFEKHWLSESLLKKPMDMLLEKTMYGDYKKIRR
ncbi:MAG: NAD(P)/FAD-dependent oxidoreductase [Nitrospirae bacterium]|nr:NAD(P)/FAD-dependent oxidoreductase [Nitrospirota bacterium]